MNESKSIGIHVTKNMNTYTNIGLLKIKRKQVDKHEYKNHTA